MGAGAEIIVVKPWGREHIPEHMMRASVDSPEEEVIQLRWLSFT